MSSKKSLSQSPDKPKDKGSKVDLLWGVKVPMRDGILLNATIFKPKDMPKPLPVIFTLTPYIADSYHDRARYFSKNGYVFAAVDARGRGNSQGEFKSTISEPQDGHDVVEWLASQPWCDGQVTMWGGSYGGYDQWGTLKEFPPHLKTIVPVAAAHPGVDMPFMNNIFYPYELQWLTYVSGVTLNDKLFSDFSFWTEKFSEWYFDHRPFKELDQIVGNLHPEFQVNLSHPTQDEFWESQVPSPADYARLDLPILTITGHYDGDQPGAMAFYRRHMLHGSAQGKDKHFLIIGPWDHAGTRTPLPEVGGLKFGKASLLDMNQLHKEWYDWTLKDGTKPEFLKKRVAYYVVGSEEWKYVDSLDEIGAHKKLLYLDSAPGSGNDCFNSGVMRLQKPSLSPTDSYVYAPLDTRPGELELEEVQTPLTDQRDALNLFGSGLVYHSEPFDEDTEVSGYLKFSAWIKMDVPDTDFMATLYEILPDGKSILLTQDYLRARYRESLQEEKLVTPGEITFYEMKNFTFFSRLVGKGSRLRFVFKSPNTMKIEKNYNNGGVVAEAGGKDARTAHITLYHSETYPSYLELPVMPRA